MRPASPSPFAAFSARTVVPYRAAIPLSVSPRLTRYVVPVGRPMARRTARRTGRRSRERQTAASRPTGRGRRGRGRRRRRDRRRRRGGGSGRRTGIGRPEDADVERGRRLSRGRRGHARDREDQEGNDHQRDEDGLAAAAPGGPRDAGPAAAHGLQGQDGAPRLGPQAAVAGGRAALGRDLAGGLVGRAPEVGQVEAQLALLGQGEGRGGRRCRATVVARRLHAPPAAVDGLEIRADLAHRLGDGAGGTRRRGPTPRSGFLGGRGHRRRGYRPDAAGLEGGDPPESAR